MLTGSCASLPKLTALRVQAGQTLPPGAEARTQKWATGAATLATLPPRARAQSIVGGQPGAKTCESGHTL
jgi:hypothetical protein